MLDIVVYNEGEPVSLEAIGERQHISQSYLEQLFRKLREHGLVESYRGPGGGYRLRKMPSDISIADIVSAVDTTSVLGDSNDRSHNSRTRHADLGHELWRKVEKHLQTYLRTITLESVLDEFMNNAPTSIAANR